MRKELRLDVPLGVEKLNPGDRYTFVINEFGDVSVEFNGARLEKPFWNGALRVLIDTHARSLDPTKILDADFVEQAYREGHLDGRSRGDDTEEAENTDWDKSITLTALKEMGYE